MKKHDELTPSDAPLVSVEWEDITGLDNWNEDDGPFQPTSIKSVGWLIEDGPKWLVIARDYDHTNEKWSSIVVIPKLPPVVMVHAGAPKIVGAGAPDTVFDDVHEERAERNPCVETEGERRVRLSRELGIPVSAFSSPPASKDCSGPVLDPGHAYPPAPDTGSWPVWTNQTDGTIPGQP